MQKKSADLMKETETKSGRRSPASAESAFDALQQSMGNRAVGHMLAPAVQAKLTVGPAGDAYEQEADRVGKAAADQISGMGGSQSSVQREAEGPELEEEELQMKRAPEGIQREAEGPELEEEELQMKRAPEGIQREAEGPELEEEELQMKRAPDGIQRAGGPEEEELQLKRSDEAFDAAPSVESQIMQKKGSGAKLDSQIQTKMEAAIGADFSNVNIHHDAESDELNRSVGALAFTQGNDVFFRQGKYDPSSHDGQELLGHELTHVVQQTGGGVS
jgi:hypothetical protein